ncbi:MAG TPA: DegV family protein [bacterium]
MKIDYVDGRRLRQAVIAGARRVIMMQDYLNGINVFPVADSDTGTNMALTLQSIAEGAISCRDASISAMSQCLAESALMGARGNSGAILAQFFQGLADSFKGQLKASVRNFAEAAEQAKSCAYDAISEPKEGTILTVIHDWTERIKRHGSISEDFREVLKEGLDEAQRSLKDTPTKLKLLSKAGVVDAGAQGFVHMLEGVLHFMESGKIYRGVGIGSNSTSRRAKIEKAPADITFQFCTECLVEGEQIPRKKLRDELSAIGNSLIVAGSSERVRIHIHTNEPQKVFATVQQYGRVFQQKQEDMRRQHEKAYGDGAATRIALVTDSSCDLTSEYIIRHNIQMVPVQLAFGKDNYIDKITITPKEFYRILAESEHYPKTSQPTPGDYLKTYDELWGHYEQALSVHLSGSLSGTLQAAQSAAKTLDNGRVRVLDGRNVSVGLGLIVVEAAKAIEQGCDMEEVVKRTERAIQNVRFFIHFSTVEYLIRGGRISRSRGLLAKILNMRPILTLDAQGRAITVAKVPGEKAGRKKTMQLVCAAARGKRNLRFAVAHANAPEKADWFVQQIKRQFEINEVMVVNVSPALGAHAGPGAAGVAFLGE